MSFLPYVRTLHDAFISSCSSYYNQSVNVVGTLRPHAAFANIARFCLKTVQGTGPKLVNVKASICVTATIKLFQLSGQM
jgi:hypothetical protein